MKQHSIRLWIWGLMTVAVMAGIFFMSAKDGNESGSLSDWLVQTAFGRTLMAILPQLTDAGAGRDIRKYAHMAEYCLLAVPSCMFFLELMLEQIPKKAAVLDFGFCFLYACTDEYHQLFVPGRVGDFRDVMIDLIGVVTGIVLVILSCRKRKEKR